MIEGFCNACGIEFNFDEVQDSLGHYLENVKMITIKPFMNSWDFDVRRNHFSHTYFQFALQLRVLHQA